MVPLTPCVMVSTTYSLLLRLWGDMKLFVHRPSSYPTNLAVLVLKQSEARLLRICDKFDDFA